MRKFIFIFILFPTSFLQAQFIPGMYADVEANKDYEFTLLADEPYGIGVTCGVQMKLNGTFHRSRLYLNGEEVLWRTQYHPLKGHENELAMEHYGRFIPGALKAGTKIHLKTVLETSGDPGDSSARPYSLYAGAVSYDSAVNLNKIEKKVLAVEQLIPEIQVDKAKDTSKLFEVESRIIALKDDLDAFRTKFDVCSLDHSQFKTRINSRMDAIGLRISSMEESLKNEINDLTHQLGTFKIDTNQFKSEVVSRLNETNENISSIEQKQKNDLKDLGQQFDAFKNENHQFKADTHLRFDHLDKKFNAQFSSIENHYRNFKETDFASTQERLASLERKQDHLFSRKIGKNDALGIVGVSLGGAAAALTMGVIFHDAIRNNSSSEKKMSFKKEIISAQTDRLKNQFLLKDKLNFNKK